MLKNCTYLLHKHKICLKTEFFDIDKIYKLERKLVIYLI